jgi:hypothetical protein
VEGHFDWNSPIRLSTSRLRRELHRPKVIAAAIFGIGGPCTVYAIRGLCWEALLGNIVIFAIALMVVRPSFSVWLAAVLVVSMCGSLGLIGWSALRFRSLNVFSSYSPRVTICGRQYEPEGSAQTHLPAPFKNLTHNVMGVTPSGSAVLGVGCQTTVLFVQSPGPVYLPYDLLGGP